MNKQYYTHEDIEKLTRKIAFQIANSNWRPDYIVGITRGGLIPAVYLSHWLDIPMWTLKVALRDNADTETNAWMAEDAYGYNEAPKNILIVDDINDTGATLDWIINNWQGNPVSKDKHWEDVWNNNVRFAVLIDNQSSKFSRKIDYVGKEINKAERDVWIVYPWELD